MKRLNYIKNIFLAIIIVGLGTYVSCNDAKHDELGIHAYIKNALSGGSTNLIVLSDEDTSTSVDIHISNLSSTDNHYILVADQSVMNEYNQKNGTNYLMIPKEFYSLSEDIVIKAGLYNAETTPIVIKTFSEEMTSSGESYALPIRLKAKEGSIQAMATTGAYVIATSPILKFSAPMFTGTADLKAEKFDSSPETYGQYTVEVRFQVSNTGNRNRTIYNSAEDEDALNKIILRFEDPNNDSDPEHKKHSLVQVVGRNSIYLNPTRSFEPNKWQHLALTCDGSTYRLYINGEYSGMKEIPAGPTTFTNVNWFTSSFWSGCKILMSEARIWSVARSELQIQNNMTLTSPKSPGLEAYWRFNEGVGNEFQDVTGKGHTLTTTKNPKWIDDILSTDPSTQWP